VWRKIGYTSGAKSTFAGDCENTRGTRQRHAKALAEKYLNTSPSVHSRGSIWFSIQRNARSRKRLAYARGSDRSHDRQGVVRGLDVQGQVQILDGFIDFGGVLETDRHGIDARIIEREL